MLYVGVIDDSGTYSMYISSVPATEDYDLFMKNMVETRFRRRESKEGDPVAQNVELNTLRNVLVAGGAQVTVQPV
jgi:hypothetical protein